MMEIMSARVAGEKFHGAFSLKQDSSIYSMEEPGEFVASIDIGLHFSCMPVVHFLFTAFVKAVTPKL